MIILILAIFFCLLPATASDQEHPPTRYFKLENGFQIFLYPRHTLPLIHLVIAFDVGSKDETEETNGLVHILEHYILFRGTEYRTGSEISQDIRRHGAYFNAHTDRDLSTFEMSLPSDYLDFALRNQKEILFHLAS